MSATSVKWLTNKSLQIPHAAFQRALHYIKMLKLLKVWAIGPQLEDSQKIKEIFGGGSLFISTFSFVHFLNSRSM